MIDSPGEYVLLAGAYNNSGDFLIAQRARRLIESRKPGSKVVELPRNKPLGGEDLERINASKALLIAGGPALRKNLYPAIAPLTEDLNDIKAPIIAYGIGWKDALGGWDRTLRYGLSERTLALLRRIDRSGYTSSIRDYQSSLVLDRCGIKNQTVTGCPALFDIDVGPEPRRSSSPKKIVLSIGTSYRKDDAAIDEIAGICTRLKDAFGAEVVAAFHHSIDLGSLEQAYGANDPIVGTHDRTLALKKRLEAASIITRDVSGGADDMIDLYRSCDAHIGYRVHAHILMSSMRKPSILFVEDGRALGLREVIGGMIIDLRSISPVAPKAPSIWRRMMHPSRSRAREPALARASEELALSLLEFEYRQKFPRTEEVWSNIERHKGRMLAFIDALP
jgi:hypothetical protein